MGKARVLTPTTEGVEQRMMESPLFGGRKLHRACRRECRDSELLEYRLGSEEGASVLVKRITYPGTPARIAEAITREFRALSRIEACAGGRLRGSFPLPLLALPDANALVMSKLPGVSLSAVLHRKANRLTGPFWRAHLCDVAHRTGRWLAEFHEATRQAPILFDAVLYLNALDQSLEQLASAGLGPVARREIFEQARHVSEKVSGCDASTAARHGDFLPQNIMVDDGRVAVVDFSDFSERGVIYEDIGDMVAYLSRLETDRFYSQASLAAIVRSFMAGYAYPFSSDLLKLHVLKQMINVAADSPLWRMFCRTLRFRRTLSEDLIEASRRLLRVEVARIDCSESAAMAPRTPRPVE